MQSPEAPALDVIAAQDQAAQAHAALAAATADAREGTPTIMMADVDPRDSRSSSSTNSPAPRDNDESDFYAVNNDSESSLGAMPNLQDMQVNDQECLPVAATLPSEILIYIFSRLNSTGDLYRSMLVCRRWSRNVVELLWHRPTCTTWPKHAKICQTLASKSRMFTYPQFIKRLNLATLSKISDGSVIPLAVCSRIERLTLTNCKDLTDHGVMTLVRNNPNLLALDVTNVFKITEESIFEIARTCGRLQGLNISNCKQISNESLIELAEMCRYIKRLKLNECEQINDNAVLAFANNCSNILEIDLHSCRNIGNDPVTALLSKGESLRELRLANCDLIDDSAFLSLPSDKVYENLRILDLTCCARLTDSAVEKIIKVAPRLRNLVLAKCGNITDAAVNAISGLGKNLHYIHLGHCRHITDEAVKRLVHSCNRIRYIDLGCCQHLTDDSVTKLALLPKLKRIGLVKCSQITDESIYALARANQRSRPRRDGQGNIVPDYHSSLERVHLSYCMQLSLPAIIRLLNTCPKLTHLSLTGVPAFLRDDLETFCREAPGDFTEHQRQVFCVFSGPGVTGLKRYLNTRPEFQAMVSPEERRMMTNLPTNINFENDAIEDDDMSDDVPNPNPNPILPPPPGPTPPPAAATHQAALANGDGSTPPFVLQEHDEDHNAADGNLPTAVAFALHSTNQGPGSPSEHPAMGDFHRHFNASTAGGIPIGAPGTAGPSTASFQFPVVEDDHGE